MNRPLNETAQNLSDEEKIAALVRAAWDVDTYKQTMAYGLDYAMTRGDSAVIGFFEAKHREWNFGDGDGFRVSLLKVMSAEKLKASTGLRCFLVIWFNGGITQFARFEDHDGRLIMAGRKDRGQAGDLEPHRIYPWSVWRKL